jgi:osmotically-inducible protein OsmY
MTRTVWLMLGLGFGWGLSQLFDPARGRGRRAVVRDKMVSVAHAVGDAVETTSRDVGNRTRGVVAELRARRSREPVSDEVLVERVRASLGGVVRHPGSVEVMANDGDVTLRGVVLRDEAPRLLRRVRAVRGVRDVDDRLEVHAEPSDVPGL